LCEWPDGVCDLMLHVEIGKLVPKRKVFHSVGKAAISLTDHNKMRLQLLFSAVCLRILLKRTWKRVPETNSGTVTLTQAES
jgi:hypothetical protein